MGAQSLGQLVSVLVGAAVLLGSTASAAQYPGDGQGTPPADETRRPPADPVYPGDSVRGPTERPRQGRTDPYRAPPPPRSKSKGVTALRVGVIVGGSGVLERDCDGSGCPDGAEPEIDYDDLGGFAIGLEALGSKNGVLYAGAGFLYIFWNGVEIGNGEVDLGGEFEVNLIIEPRISATPELQIPIRGFMGIGVYLGGDGLEDMEASYDAQCDTSLDLTCSVREAPYVGVNYGLGVGGVYDLDGDDGNMGVRVDVLWQGYWWRGPGTDRDEMDIVNVFSGSRIWLMTGVEF